MILESPLREQLLLTSARVGAKAGLTALALISLFFLLPSAHGQLPRRRPASNYYFKRLAFPFKTIPAKAFERAAEQRDRMPVGTIGGDNPTPFSLSAGSQWNSIGPYNWNPLLYGQNSYSGTGPISGRINAIVYDPQASTTLYLGSASGGVFKSTDSGNTWTSLSDNWKFLNISCIAVDPTNSKNLYVGTGDFQGGNNATFVGGT